MIRFGKLLAVLAMVTPSVLLRRTTFYWMPMVDMLAALVEGYLVAAAVAALVVGALSPSASLGPKPSKLRRYALPAVVLGILLPTVVASIAVDYQYEYYLGAPPDPSDIRLFLEERNMFSANSLGSVGEFMATVFSIAVPFLAGLALFVTLDRRNRKARSGERKWRFQAVALLAALLLGHGLFEALWSPALAFPKALARYQQTPAGQIEIDAARVAGTRPNRSLLATARGPSGRPNVLLMVEDSLGRRLMYTEDGQRALPFFREFLARPEVYEFPQAVSASGSTDTSLPGILNGRLLIGGDERAMGAYIDLPTLSEHARSADYATAIYSSTRTRYAKRWSQLNRPLAAFDEICSLDTLGGVPVNSYGLDDREVAGLLASHLSDGRFDDRPWFILVLFNNMHHPFLVDEASYREPEGASQQEIDIARYTSALGLMDQALRTVVEAVEHAGQADNTVVVLSSDHGETPGSRYLRNRHLSYDVLSVPLVFSVPPGLFPSPKARAAFLRRRDQPVSNLDIYPTLLELLGLDASGVGQADGPWVAGESLLSRGEKDRTLVGYQGPPFLPHRNANAFLLSRDQAAIFYINRGAASIANIDTSTAGKAEAINWADADPATRSLWLDQLGQIPELQAYMEERGVIDALRSPIRWPIR